MSVSGMLIHLALGWIALESLEGNKDKATN